MALKRIVSVAALSGASALLLSQKPGAPEDKPCWKELEVDGNEELQELKEKFKKDKREWTNKHDVVTNVFADKFMAYVNKCKGGFPKVTAKTNDDTHRHLKLTVIKLARALKVFGLDAKEHGKEEARKGPAYKMFRSTLRGDKDYNNIVLAAEPEAYFTDGMYRTNKDFAVNCCEKANEEPTVIEKEDMPKAPEKMAAKTTQDAPAGNAPTPAATNAKKDDDSASC